MLGRSFSAPHLFTGQLRLWWGKANERPDRPRNLFGSFELRPSPAQMFRAGDCISREGVVDRSKLHRLMEKLVGRIGAEDPQGTESGLMGGCPKDFREIDRVPGGHFAAALDGALVLGLATRLSAKWRTAAMFAAPWPARRRLRSSLKVTSRTQCREFSISQSLRATSAKASAESRRQEA
jgi:hypothetical protein